MKTIKLSKTPKIPFDGWKVHYHNGITTMPKELGLHLEPEQKDGYIKGEVLAERIKATVLNSCHLDYLYKHQELIPEEWKNKWVYFWGTIFVRANGDLYVRYIYWRDEVCNRDYRWLDRKWNSGNPAAVSASSSKNLDSKTSALIPFALGAPCPYCGELVKVKFGK